MYYIRTMKITGVVVLFFFSQILGAQALNTTYHSNWNDKSLLIQGGLRYNDVWGYTAKDGKEYAILGSRNFTHFIDISDPQNPTEVHREQGQGNCLWRDFKTYGDYAYGTGEFCNSGLEIYDLSDLPNSVQKVYDSNEFFTDAHNVWIDTAVGRLYAVGITSGTANAVALDISLDPTSPVHIKDITFPDYGYVHDIHVINNIAYASHGTDRLLVIYDFSTLPGDPIQLSQIPSNGYNHSAWVTDDGTGIVIADETFNAPVIIADISDNTSPVQTSTFKSTLLGSSGSIAHNPFIVGNDFVTLSYYDDGLQIYKMDQMDAPFLAGYYDTDTVGTVYSSDGAWGAYPYFPSGTIVASDIQYGLFVISPTFPMRDCQNDVQVSGTYDNHWEIISKDEITSSASYSDNAELIMRAPDQVCVKEEFSIEQGSTLEVYIEDACLSSRSSTAKGRLKGKGVVQPITADQFNKK